MNGPAGERGALALLRRLLQQMTSHDRLWMAGGAAVAAASALCALALLAVAGHFITAMAIAGAGGLAINYYTPAALIRLLAILRTGGRYGERLATHEATLRVLARLRVWLFARLVPLAPAGLGGLRGSALFSRLRGDVDALEHGYLGALVPLATAAAVVVAVLAVALAYLPPLVPPLLVLFGLAGVLLPRRAWVLGQGPGADAIECTEALRALAVDGVQGRAELALYGAEATHAEAVARLTAQLHQARRTTDRLAARGSGLVALSAQLAMLSALAIGAFAVRGGLLDGADLTLLVLLALGAFEVLLPLPEAWAQLGATLASARRIFALADRPPPVQEPTGHLAEPAGNDLYLRDVRLRYVGAAAPALDGVDLDLPQGRRIALVGASGAGKSSLAAALLHLYPYQGTITLGGRPLTEWPGDAVRARIALVDQQPYLFDASLRSNLLLARPDAGDTQLNEAIHRAQLEPFVASLPRGLDTLVGENGARVSGGEARRIAIARALLADAPILVLDEPTEGLDAVTAAGLYRALAAAMDGRSVLIITHRLGGLTTLADDVLVMERGKITGPRPMPSCSGQPEPAGERA